jgi:hypothetical protein
MLVVMASLAPTTSTYLAQSSLPIPALPFWDEDRLSDVSFFGLWTVKKDSFESAKRKKVATQESAGRWTHDCVSAEKKNQLRS